MKQLKKDLTMVAVGRNYRLKIKKLVKKKVSKSPATTTNFSAEIDNQSFKLAKQIQNYLGLSTNAQLLDWLLEKGRRSISRSSGSDPFGD